MKKLLLVLLASLFFIPTTSFAKTTYKVSRTCSQSKCYRTLQTTWKTQCRTYRTHAVKCKQFYRTLRSKHCTTKATAGTAVAAAFLGPIGLLIRKKSCHTHLKKIKAYKTCSREYTGLAKRCARVPSRTWAKKCVKYCRTTVTKKTCNTYKRYIKQCRNYITRERTCRTYKTLAKRCRAGFTRCYTRTGSENSRVARTKTCITFKKSCHNYIKNHRTCSLKPKLNKVCRLRPKSYTRCSKSSKTYKSTRRAN